MLAPEKVEALEIAVKALQDDGEKNRVAMQSKVDLGAMYEELEKARNLELYVRCVS